MARTRTRGSGLFSGLVLISAGVILLLHFYGQLELGAFFWRWWPLLIIFWGLVKLYERTIGLRDGSGGGGVSAGEVLLVLGMLALLAIVLGVERGKRELGDVVDLGGLSGDSYTFDIDTSPVKIPPSAHVLVRNSRGDISVRASDEPLIRVSAKKNVKSWSETDAERLAKPVRVEITPNGDGYEVHPAGFSTGDSRIGVDLEVDVPKQCPLTVKTEKGDVIISDLQAPVSVVDQNGDVEVRGTTGDVSVEMHKGDAKISDTKGDLKISGKGGEIEVHQASGGLIVDGDFYGPVRAEKVAKGVRLVSARTDLTLSSLAGEMEVGSGNLDILDSQGLMSVRTRDTEINVENPGGKVKIDNRNGQTAVRFTSAPKEDVEITNSSAGITLTLPGISSFEITAECRNCDIDSEFPGLGATKSESGDARLDGKYGSAKGPKITLKTSYGNISLRRTTITIPPKPLPPAPPLKAVPPAPIPPATEQ